MKKFVKKGAYLPSSHVQEEKNVILHYLGILGFMGKISFSLVMKFLQWWMSDPLYSQNTMISFELVDFCFLGPTIKEIPQYNWP